MKEQILEIAKKLTWEEITVHHAKTLFLELFEVSQWVYLIEEEPPSNTDLLAKNPNGMIYFVEWDAKKKNFSPHCDDCFGDSQYIYKWQWKLAN